MRQKDLDDLEMALAAAEAEESPKTRAPFGVSSYAMSGMHLFSGVEMHSNTISTLARPKTNLEVVLRCDKCLWEGQTPPDVF